MRLMINLSAGTRLMQVAAERKSEPSCQLDCDEHRKNLIWHTHRICIYIIQMGGIAKILDSCFLEQIHIEGKGIMPDTIITLQ
jgi:hypothetical protein